MKHLPLKVLLLALVLFLTGCSTFNVLDQKNKGKESEEEPEVKVTSKMINDKKNKQRNEDVDPFQPTNEELTLFEVNDIDDIIIERKAIDNLYDDDNNFPTHTEQEIVQEFADD